MKKHISAVRHELQKITLFSALFLSVGICAWAQVPNYVPSNGLVGWWPFNGNANDLSGNANNGTVNGATLTTDRFGNSNKAYSFDGVNDNINPLQNNLPFGTTARTISVWFQRIGTGGCLFSYGSANTSNAYMIAIGANIISNQGWADDFPVYPSIDNSWHNLVCTFDGLNSTIYLDNSNLGSNSMTSWNTIAGSFYFGTRVLNDMDFFNGKLDDIGIWNRALSQCEISQLYNSQLSSTSGVNLGPDTLNICGINTTLDATNPAAAYYSWNNGETTQSISVSSSGEYSVTVIDTAGCSSSDTVFVSVIDPTITAGQSAFCLGDSTALSINTNANSCGNLTGSLQNGLQGWWTFCGNANDESGNGNNGTVNGATLTTDRFGNANGAYSFDGVNDWININNSNSLNPNSQITISAWVNTLAYNVSNASMVVNKGWDQGPGHYDLLVFSSNNKSRFVIGSNIYVESNSIINLNQWTLITASIDSLTMKIYVNGTLENTVLQNNNNSFGTNTDPLYIGKHDYNSAPYYFNGKIDDIGIWNRALTQQEIQQLYNQGNLSSWWSDGTTNQSIIQVQPTQTTTYSVTVSDGVGSCTDSITIQVNNPQINAGNDLSVCAGDSTALTAEGATTYSWNNGVVNGQAFVPTVEGLYSVVGTDTLGCSNSDTLLLDLLQPTSSNIERIACDTYTAPDGNVYTSSGQYFAIIPNAEGCDSTIQLALTVNNSSSSAQTTTELDSYTWPVNGQTYTQSGVYSAVIQNSKGCDSTITLNLSLEFSGISELNGKEIVITPNPVDASFTLIADTKYIGNEYILTNQQGAIVGKGTIRATKMEVNCGHLAKGIYLFQINSTDQHVIRVMKN